MTIAHDDDLQLIRCASERPSATSHNYIGFPRTLIIIVSPFSHRTALLIASRSLSVPSTSCTRRLRRNQRHSRFHSHPLYDPIADCFPLFPPLDHDDPSFSFFFLTFLSYTRCSVNASVLSFRPLFSPTQAQRSVGTTSCI